MNEAYWIGFDQSTQGTKALLLSAEGELLRRRDKAHEQIVNELGWVSHDPEEIYRNLILATAELLGEAGVDAAKIAGVSISNQRETALMWNRETGAPLDKAIVWQCARGRELSEDPRVVAKKDLILEQTGIVLSPYFPAAKIGWLMRRHPEAERLAAEGKLCAGTMDSYLVYRMTHGASFFTDASNASRTQLFDVFRLRWSPEICQLFGVPLSCLAQVCASDGIYGQTDLEGILPKKVPICGVMGDSHAALFGQGCLEKGQVKATYGTGTSVMMNVGDTPVKSQNGLVTSIGWQRGRKVEYVLEANLNYTGAVIRWMEKDVGLVANAGETETLAEAANPQDSTYLVPAFSGLGAPFWKSDAKALLCGLSRTTGRAELVKAGLESIAYQIADVIFAMEKDLGERVPVLRVDGGATKNAYLMRLQSGLLNAPVDVSRTEELSGMGAAWMGGLALGLFTPERLKEIAVYRRYEPTGDRAWFQEKYDGWLRAVHMLLG